MNKKAVLLINLGTPDHCDTQSVRRFLREFLTDPRVIDIPRFFRWILVNFIILPLRSKKSAAAYQKIWQDSGSPLLVNTQRLQEALSIEMGEGYQVEFAMRYGHPNIPSVVNKLKNSESIIAVPLFPQYSSAATGSALEKLSASVATQWNVPALQIKKDFYADPGFINAYADLIRQHIHDKKIDLLLFSYHGLPERHINKSDCHASCDRVHACPKINIDNQHCYRAHCYLTSHLIAEKLGFTAHQFSVSFQSRLGRTPWIKPYTDLLLPDLIQQGMKHIAIVCPSFVADCLETLEEVNIRMREQWLALGGTGFTFVPCLNDAPMWVQALAVMLRENGNHRDDTKQI